MTTKLSKNFSQSEFRCSCGECGEPRIDPELVERLQTLRDEIGLPIKITSAYRCPEYNARVGGVNKSQHTRGTAADIVVQGMKPATVGRICSIGPFKNGGVGVYVTKGFTHVDTRGYAARWQG